MAVRRVISEGEVRSFLLEGCTSGSVFYSSSIAQRPSNSWKPLSFDCVLERRRRELVDASLIFEIATVEVLVGVVTTLVNCSTWTNAKFHFRCGLLRTREESSELVMFERLIFEVYYLHRLSPSLLCLDVSCTVAYSHAHHRHGLETVTVHDAPAERGVDKHFGAFAEALAGGVSRNCALKSLTLHTSSNYCHLADEKSLEVLFTSATMMSVKELVLRFPNCVPWYQCAAVVNLVHRNTTLEKLTLCSTNSWSRLKDVTYTWTKENHGRALQVKYSGTDFFFSARLIRPLTKKLSLDYNSDGIFPRRTDISTLHLSLSLDHLVIASNYGNLSPREWVQTISDSMLSVVTSVASMSARRTTLKHVQMSFQWGREVNDMLCRYRKQVELLTQEKLREMVGNELRGNISLETLEVGFWKLIRRAQHVGGGTDEWHMSYLGPCLSESTISNEYVVEVQI